MIRYISQVYMPFATFAMSVTENREFTPADADNAFRALTAIGVAMTLLLGLIFLAFGFVIYIMARRKDDGIRVISGQYLGWTGNVLVFLGNIGRLVVRVETSTPIYVWQIAVLIVLILFLVFGEVFLR